MTHSIKVSPILSLKDNYVWALIDTTTQHTLVVDPGEVAPVQKFLQQEGLILTGILITHHHWDHTNGVAELQRMTKAVVVGAVNSSIPQITQSVHANEMVTVSGFPLTLRIIAIPGHTLDHVAYYTEGMLFCGDTLFAAGCGRIFEGTAEQMYVALQKLAALPEDTKIYCGHEYTLNNLRFAQLVEPNNQAIAKRIMHVRELRAHDLPSLPATLREEKATNPFLRCNAPELIASVERFSGKKLITPVEVFTWVRKWKDTL